MPVPYIGPVLNMLGAITAKGLRRTCDTHYSISLLWKTKYLAVKNIKNSLQSQLLWHAIKLYIYFFNFCFNKSKCIVNTCIEELTLTVLAD